MARGAFLLLLLAVASAWGNDRPNILWIVAEDMSPTLGCYGDAYATTPNIDRLAAQSVRYTNAFATAPVCSPSRSCLITGCYATTLGTQQMRSAFPLPKGMRGFPALLRDAGYYTSNNFKTDYNTSSAPEVIRDSWDESSNTAHWRKRPEGDAPFFSVFNIMTSHQSRSMVYTQSRFRKEVQSLLSADDIHDPDTVPLPPYYPDTLVSRRIWARYHDCVTAMDDQVGRILAQLEEDGLADDTIVFFYSDHGSGMPRHKRLLHDSGMHVPLLVRVPKKYQQFSPGAPGDVLDRLVSFVDFPPTVLGLAGLPRKAYMQGSTFLGEASRGSQREYVYGHRDRIDEVVDVARSVRDERYLYIRNFMPGRSWNQYSSYSDLSEIRHEFYRIAEGNGMTAAQQHYAGPRKPAEELYDCVADPHNIRNLAGEPDHAETLQRLRGAMKEHVTGTQDLGFLPEVRAWELFDGDTPMSLVSKASPGRDEAARTAAGLFSPEGDATANWINSEFASQRYWAAIALQSAAEITPVQWSQLRKGLNDESLAVRIEMASAVCQHGELQLGLPVLVGLLEHDDLNVVLYATRAIEMLGTAAANAKGAMENVAARADRLQASSTQAVFDQSGEKDLAMFCSFSAHGFLDRLKLGKWHSLVTPGSLQGWSRIDSGVAVSADGTISMLSKGKNLWIAHEQEFADFELTAEVKMPLDGYNAGIGFRCEIQANGRPKGYQCEVANEESGMLYAIASGGWVWPRGDQQRNQFFGEVGAAFRKGSWNHFRVRCEGPRIQLWVNGILTTDIEDSRHTKGRIALQHHGKGDTHFYRNVLVRKLNE